MNLKSLSVINKFTYSYNEARLSAFYKIKDLEDPYSYDGYKAKSDNGIMLIICPLYNTRVIP